MARAVDLLLVLACLVIASGSVDETKEQIVVLNSTVIIQCSLNKAANTSISWYKDNKSVVTLGGRFAIVDKKELRIASLAYEDEGVYMCSNQNNKSSSPVMLRVYGSPEVQVFPRSDAQVHEGQQVSRMCRARGRPQPTVEWFTTKNQRVNSSGNSTAPSERIYVNESLVGNVSKSELKITSVIFSDNGVFRCVASNRHSTMTRTSTINVQSPPKAINPSNSTRIVHWWDTAAVNLTCKAEGNPPPTITWSPEADDKEIKLNCSGSHPLSTKVESTCWLKSEGNTTYEGGNYTCYAENSLGKISLHNFVVQRIYPPLNVQFRLAKTTSKEFVMAASVAVKENSPPASYILTRYKDINGQFKHKLMSNVDPQCGCAEIVLPGIRPGREYEISMAAMNSAGYGLWTFMIQESGTMLTTTPEPITRHEIGEIFYDIGFNNNVTKNATSGAAQVSIQNSSDNVNTSSIKKPNSLCTLLCLLLTYLCCQLIFSSNLSFIIQKQ